MKCICGKEFEGKRSTARFCSPRCRKLSFLSVPDLAFQTPVSVPKNGKTLSVPCQDCLGKDKEINRLVAKVALLELRKGVEALPLGDDAESLRARVLAAKFSRIRGIGMVAHAG